MTRDDLSVIGDALAAAGLRPGYDALDPVRPPRRTLDLPRYVAMQEYFDRRGPAGRAMMCSTAALQVCVDAGLDGDGSGSAARRWRRLHRLAPVLAAMFANSPLQHRRPERLAKRASGRLAGHRPGPHATSLDRPRPAERVGRVCARRSAALHPQRRRTVGAAARPDDAILAARRGPAVRRHACSTTWTIHVSTLFPPVRPRGFLELRVVDAQPGSGWEVAVAMVAAPRGGRASERPVGGGVRASRGPR